MNIFHSRKLLVFSLLGAALLLLAFLAPWLCPQDPYATDMSDVFAKPSFEHWLGTDNLGRDVFARLLSGLRPSLFSALGVVAAVFLVGTALGVAAGYLGGIADRAVMWLVTTFQAFPGFLLAVVIAGFLGGGLFNACIGLLDLLCPFIPRPGALRAQAGIY